MPFPKYEPLPLPIRPSYDAGFRPKGGVIFISNPSNRDYTLRLFVRGDNSQPRKLYAIYVVPPGDNSIVVDRDGEYSYSFVSKGVSIPAHTF